MRPHSPLQVTTKWIAGLMCVLLAVTTGCGTRDYNEEAAKAKKSTDPSAKNSEQSASPTSDATKDERSVRSQTKEAIEESKKSREQSQWAGVFNASQAVTWTTGGIGAGALILFLLRRKQRASHTDSHENTGSHEAKEAHGPADTHARPAMGPHHRTATTEAKETVAPRQKGGLFSWLGGGCRWVISRFKRTR